ncbi:DNA-binding protein [Mycobacterium heckeshornense]|uniref:Zn-ribbon domain-containing OB-fold protein n=1 Tax=Mycobacterium heckeshornense TaxID=110505 RepID=UPI0006628DF0|nr:OB-fold domain-containing protein [Mycobacterium heckeshornense]KMV23218.1 DNA-binding protein [Mycobacterium heckeshornense]MCV7035312.1 OB-fold domain-containing protein [Mycobacterium heckeshornense]PIJ31911.1 DNA-binding protein [Mycobacterium heckeshornense]
MLPDDRALWSRDTEGRLLIEHCDSCPRWVHPPSAQCPRCGGPLLARPVSGRGTVLTYTVNFHPYNPAVPTPYVIAIVELAEQPGLRLATNIVDCEPDSVVCGMPVEVQFEQQGTGADAVFVPVFAPAGDAGTARRAPT